MNATAIVLRDADRRTVLTDKGVAVVHAYRLLEAIRELGADDRAAVLELLHLELEHQV
jgi:hypothetical protein